MRNASLVPVLLTWLAVIPASPAQGQVTDANGYIRDTQWLVLGPFQTTVGCDQNAALLTENFIAPSYIFCEYPQAGDEIVYDPTLAASGCYSDGCVIGEAGDPAVDSAICGAPPCGCRVVDIRINGELVENQFSRHIEATTLLGRAEELPTTATYGTVIAKSYGVTVGGDAGFASAIDITIQDLGGGNPPENAAINAISIAGGAVGRKYVRGDTNADGGRNIADPVYLLNNLFAGGAPCPCREACDVNDDGAIDIADPVYELNNLFGGGAPIPPPATCNEAPVTEDVFSCDEFLPCG